MKIYGQDYSSFILEKLQRYNPTPVISQSSVKSPSDHMSLRQLKAIKDNNYFGAGGIEYVAGEVDSRINQLQSRGPVEENPTKKANKEFKVADHISVSEDDFWDGIGEFEKIHYQPTHRYNKDLKRLEFITANDGGVVIGFVDARDEKKHKFWLHRKLKRSSVVSEDSWASEVGSIRSELGEIEEIYKDFDSIYKRLNGITDIVTDEGRSKITKLLDKAYMTIASAEIGFREVTKSSKAPARTPIRLSTPVADSKREMERISSDLAKLSVRVRNIGQATDDLENVDVGTVPDQFERASEQIRKAFVQFEKLIP